MNNTEYQRPILYVLLFIGTIILGAVLKITASVFLPIVIAILLSFIFYPIVKKMNTKFKIPWVLGTILVILTIIVIIGLLSTIIGTSLSTILNQYPKYESKFMSIYKIFAENLNLTFNEDQTFFQNIWGQLKIREFIQNIALSFSGDLISITKNLGMILLLTAFLLLEINNCKEKIIVAFENSGKTQNRIVALSKKTITDVVRFLSIKFFISFATGFLVFISVAIVKLDFAIMWGFLAFVLNFIPTFGSIFSVVITTIFALLQFYPNPGAVIFVFIALTSINMILGNVIEPRIEGKDLGLSPFVILVSLTIWGWIWGFIGMILAVPLTVILKIICENVEFLHGIAIILGNKPSETKLYKSSAEENTENQVSNTKEQ